MGRDERGTKQAPLVSNVGTEGRHMLSPVLFVLALAAAQPAESSCSDPVSLDAAGVEGCRAQEQVRLADAAPKDSRERTQRLEETVTVNFTTR
jgi:hypothetical protein